MALTTATEIRLTNAEFSKEFDNKRDAWLKMAQAAYNYTKGTVAGAPKPDDVAPHLALALEASREFLKIKGAKGTAARYWFTDFADFIIDRTWKELA